MPDFVINLCSRTDITEDGTVDLFDLAKIASNWLKPIKEENSLNQIVDWAVGCG